MHDLKRVLTALFLFLLTPAVSAASPWMWSEGEMYYSGSLSYTTGDKNWNENSNLVDSSCRSRNVNSHQLIEYGYSYYHTLIANLDIVSKDCGGDNYLGLGDLRLGIRGRLDPFRNGRTWEVTAIIPTGYSDTDPARPGNGKFGIEGGVAYLSRGEYRDSAKRWDYLTGASLRFWVDGPADQFIGYFTLRRYIGRHGYISAGVNAEISFQNEARLPKNLSDQTQLADFDKITAKLNWSDRLSDEWRYSIGASHVVWGRNAGHDLKIGITFSRHWRL